jgi:hypothetical protein
MSKGCVVDRLDAALNTLHNLTVEEARRRLLGGDADAVAASMGPSRW